MELTFKNWTNEEINALIKRVGNMNRFCSQAGVTVNGMKYILKNPKGPSVQMKALFEKVERELDLAEGKLKDLPPQTVNFSNEMWEDVLEVANHLGYEPDQIVKLAAKNYTTPVLDLIRTGENVL